MVSRNRPSRTPRKCLAIPEVKFGDLTWNRDWAFCFHASTAWTVAFSMFLARQSLTSGTGQQFHAFFLFNNPLLGTGGEKNLYAMCYQVPTEYVICEISGYSSKLPSRNAVICKRQDESQKFDACIQPKQASESKVVVCAKNHSFDCDLPENKTFDQLSAGDILTSTLF